MTNETELRDRIAAVILANFNPPDDRHPSWWINPDASAQAIIDEFGLYLQKKPTLTRREADDELIRDRQYRVVGKWEKQ